MTLNSDQQALVDAWRVLATDASLWDADLAAELANWPDPPSDTTVIRKALCSI
jgi:hypothetical protein